MDEDNTVKLNQQDELKKYLGAIYSEDREFSQNIIRSIEKKNKRKNIMQWIGVPISFLFCLALELWNISYYIHPIPWQAWSSLTIFNIFMSIGIFRMLDIIIEILN